MKSSAVSYKNHGFLPQIIAYAVWLYFRFPLSLQLVEEMLLKRGRCHFNLNSVVRETFCLGG